MANPKLNFLKQSTVPSNAGLGTIWFNPTTRTINVRIANSGVEATDWEAYAGKLNDATWNGSILTITKYDGSQLQLDFSDVASLSGVQTALTGLQNQITANTEAIGDSTKGLVKGVADNASAIATEKSRAEGAEAGLQQSINGVSAALATETSERKAADQGLDTRLQTVEGKVAALATATHFIGVKDALPESGVAGDVVVVGNKEYIYDPIHDPKWIELGDTTAEAAAIEENKSAIAANKAAIESNDADIEALQGRATTVEGKVSTLETNSATKAELQSEVASLQGQITSNDADIEALQGRATTVEGKVTTLEGKVSALEGAKGDYATKTELQAVDAKVETNKSNLATAMSDIDDLKTAVGNLETNSATKAELKAVEDQVKSNDTDITNLQSKDAELVAEDARLAGLIGDANGGLTKKINDEITRATAKEAELVNEDTRIAGLVSTEQGRAEAAEAALSGRVSTLETQLTWGSFE